jgi:hypothetical protein
MSDSSDDGEGSHADGSDAENGDVLNRPHVQLPPRKPAPHRGSAGGGRRVPSTGSGGVASSLLNGAFPVPSHRLRTGPGGGPTTMGWVACWCWFHPTTLSMFLSDLLL